MMERERVIQIVEAYGADPARWPEGEREAVRAAIQADLPLRRLADEALALDAALAGWARRGPADDEAIARRAAEAALGAADRPARRWLPAGLFGGAAMAAAVAGALAFLPLLSQQPAPTAKAQAPATQTATTTLDPIDSHIWSMTFTPTPDEETLI